MTTRTGLAAFAAVLKFIDTIRNARHMGAGRPILPPMPAPVYANLTDDDLGAVYEYLQTVPAISNKVPAPLPPKASLDGQAATGRSAPPRSASRGATR